MAAEWAWVSFWADENVLGLESDDGCKTFRMYEMQLNCALANGEFYISVYFTPILKKVTCSEATFHLSSMYHFKG